MDEGFEDFDYDPFDWSGYEDYEEDSGEGGLVGADEDAGAPEVAETETIESANSESAASDTQESDVAVQEANTNDIQESEAEQGEFGTPVDLSWIGASDLSTEEKGLAEAEEAATPEIAIEDKTETKTEDKTEAKEESTTQYPNGMSREEFNAMYEFALGMTGKGGNQQLDDYGEPMGYWGDFETIPLSIEEIQQEISDLQAQYETLESRGTLSESQANNIQAEIKENEDRLSAAQEQLDSLNAFIDNYASLYIPIEKEEQQKELQSVKATAAYEQVQQEQFTAWGNLTQALIKAGMDYNLSAEEVLKMEGNKFELPKESKNYATKAAEAIVKNFTSRGFKGGDFVIPVNTAAKENGNYLVKIAPAAGIGVSNYNVGIISPKGEFVVKGNVVAPSGWANGYWDLKDKDGKTIAKGESTSAFAQSVTKALSEAAIADYENSQSTSSIPEEVRAAAQAVIAAEKNYEEKERELEKAQRADRAAIHKSATDSKQDVIDKYARGELNAYQAAVELSKINDSMLDFNYNSITSNINYDDFKDKAAPVAGVTGGTVGISDFIADVSPVNPATSAINETNISKEITRDFKSLNEVKDAVDKINVSSLKEDPKAINDVRTAIENVNTALDTLAASTYLDLAKELLANGVALAELDKQPEMQALNNEVYAIAQNILDKASELKEISQEYGLYGLTKKDIKGSKDNPTARGYYSAQVALITGKNGVELLDKQDIKALVKYSKSIDATIDSAKALMTAAAVLHGAQDVQGGKYAQAWKAEKAESKLTAKEWFATAATSTIDLLATILGFGMMGVNPLIGGALAYAGTKGLIEKTGKTVGKQTQAHLTNYERMFGSQDKKGASIVSNVYDRGFNKANFGDVKSVGTYTSSSEAILDALNAMAMLTNPVTAVAGLGILYKAGKSMSVDLSKGSYSGKQNNLITNVWRLTTNIEEWADTNLNSQQLAELLNATESVDILEVDDNRERREGETARSDYGTEDADVKEDADDKFSGYSEEAKNKNVAKDYNAGMEQEVNEAVSDKYAKVFKVMIDKEPDYIRKVLIAIPKMHSEREW